MSVEPFDTWLQVSGMGLVLVLCWAALWSVPALLWRRNDIADVGWGLTFVMLAMLAGGLVVALDVGESPRPALVLALVCLWGFRLALHIGRRTLTHGEEDKRYAAWRSEWGRTWWWRSILQVFLLQALIALIVSQPVLIATAVSGQSTTLTWLDAIALVVFVSGFMLEAVADRQLRRFLVRKQAGTASTRYLTTGVWAWSRHPNYAGDSIVWIGLGLFGVSTAVANDTLALIVPALIGPLVMAAFLRWGSGVPLTERGRAGQPEWDAYVARTSVFWPRPPRSVA